MSTFSDLISEATELRARIRQLSEENVRLRNKLREIAKACPSCDGTGVVTVYDGVFLAGTRDDAHARQEECGDCLDLREALSA